jgi:DNA-directed RNA polymerase specialized sigma24 family protein
MDIKILRVVYKKQLFKLDKFFHTLLWKNVYTRNHLEVHKATLHGNLFQEMVRILNEGKYTSYPLDKLVFTKARKVYIDYVRSLERECKRKKQISTDEPPENYATSSLQNEIEAKNAVSLIRKFLDPDDFNLLYMRAAEGRSYKQILKVVSFPSEDAAKTRYYRIKNLVKQHLGIQLIYKN